jgi:hypothetical protein
LHARAILIQMEQGGEGVGEGRSARIAGQGALDEAQPGWAWAGQREAERIFIEGKRSEQF